jgi:hypothetical protein
MAWAFCPALPVVQAGAPYLGTGSTYAPAAALVNA